MNALRGRRRQRIGALCSFIAVLALGFAFGVLVSIAGLSRTGYVHVGTGQLREEIRIGPVLVQRSEHLGNGFALIPAPRQAQFDAQAMGWRAAYRFRGRSSRYSPSMTGMPVQEMMTHVAQSVELIGMERASEIKTRYITHAAAGDPYAAAKQARLELDEALAASGFGASRSSR